MAQLFYDNNADLERLKGRPIAIIGFGSQGHAHALNLKESGLDVRVGLYEGSKSWSKAEAAGLRVRSVADASKEAQVIMIVTPDTGQAALYRDAIGPNLAAGKTLMFAHGFNIRYGQIVPPAEVDVSMIAPKAPGHRVREVYTQGGGVPALVKAGFETLVESGYQPEVAYFECMHELKLIVDLFYQGGLNYMRYSVSDTAEYGDYVAGPRLVDDRTRATMRALLADIKSGAFAEEWIEENRRGRPTFARLRERDVDHPIEHVGRELRRVMPVVQP